MDLGAGRSAARGAVDSAASMPGLPRLEEGPLGKDVKGSGTESDDATPHVDEHGLPDPPSFSEAIVAECRRRRDWMPMLFEWYKFVALVTNFFARLHGEQPMIRALPRVHYAVLAGLLSRVSRLMASNVVLSHKGFHGETTLILDRCIFESCVNIAWLCSGHLPDAFERYLAEGLQTEVEFDGEIRARIKDRGGGVLQIEERMLASIGRTLASANMTKEVVLGTKKMPDMAARISALGHERLLYVVGQRIGSHHVHGTWVSLRAHYLEEADGGHLRQGIRTSMLTSTSSSTSPGQLSPRCVRSSNSWCATIQRRKLSWRSSMARSVR